MATVQNRIILQQIHDKWFLQNRGVVETNLNNGEQRGIVR
jgi:hypothetical protein